MGLVSCCVFVFVSVVESWFSMDIVIRSNVVFATAYGTTLTKCGALEYTIQETNRWNRSSFFSKQSEYIKNS